MNEFWQAGFWASGFWAAGFWGGAEVPEPPAPTSGGGFGFLPEKKPRRDTDDDVMMCFLL